MSRFEKYEKKLINFIASKDDYEANLINFLDPFLSKINIEVDKRTNQVELHLDKNQFSDKKEIQKLINATQLRVLRAVSLIRYLESERYLLTFEPYNHSPQKISFGQISNPNAYYNFNDRRVGELLAIYFDRQLVATPLLKKLVENDFKTVEERRFNKQHIATWAGIIVAFLIGASSLWISYTNSKIQTNEFSNFSNKLNRSLDSLEYRTKKTNQQLKYLNEQISIQNDSLNFGK